MRYKREIFENLIAEIVARFVIGFGAAAFFGFWMLPDIAGYWDDVGWRILLAPAAVGALFAALGVRNGPGVI